MKKLKKFPDYAEREVLFKIKKSRKIGVSDADMKSVDTYIDRDTMTLLVMGFNGDKAFEWKKQYIEAFNLMEAKMHEPKQLATSIYTDKELELLIGIKNQNDKIANAIIDSKLAIQSPQLVQVAETKQEVKLIESHREEKAFAKVARKVKGGFTKQTQHQYYSLPITPLYKLTELDNPASGEVIFEYYDSQCSLISLKAYDWKVFKIKTPYWLKELGNYGKHTALVKYRRAGKKGFLDKIIEG